MRINLVQDGPHSFRISKKILKDVERVISGVGRATKNTEINVVITTAAKSKKLNKKYRDKSYIPDVLTFRYPDSKEVLGELIMVPEVVKKQARERKHTQETEFTILLVHGIVHMLGYEHEGVSTAKKVAMKRLELKILSKLGLELSDRSY